MLKKNKTWMIRIDHLSFEFGAPDERFAQNLYADWESFCHRCFERVVEECLVLYDDDQTLHELEQLNLDLGSIPEDDFYDEFPRRLKEALTNALPSLHDLQAQANPHKVTASRINNLLFLLKYGHPLPEWADTNYQPQKEIEQLTESSDTCYDAFIWKAALLCLRQEHALRRLAEQTDSERTLLDVYATALAEPSAGQTEKRRLLTLLLEIKPDLPIRFVHKTSDSNRLREMSDLLDTLSVRRIIRTEAKEHAEVDIPPYWHYLYEWLIKYYPYNGIAIFGNKTEFTRHLHHRLLTYIHKRDGAPYLSKAELTISFLLEVFGPTYYKNVLNAIYLLQPHKPDGSPVYDHYFNQELFRIFLQLSLLRLPETTKENPSPNEGQEKESMKLPTKPKSIPAILTDLKDLHTILKDPVRSNAYKQMLWTWLVREQPEVLLLWLQSESLKDDTLLPLLTKLSEDTTVNRLLATYSLSVLDIWTTLRKYIAKQRDSLTWLKEISDAQWESAFRRSALRLLASATSRQTGNIRNILCLIYQEVTGDNTNEATAVDALVRQLKEDGFQVTSNEGNETMTKHNNNLLYLHRTIHNSSLSETVKRRIIACYWDKHQEDSIEAVRLLQEQNILDDVLELTDYYAWETILHRILRQTVGIEKASSLMPLYQWLATHKVSLSSHLTDSSHSLRTRLLLGTVRLAQEGNNTSLEEIVPFLLASLFHENNLPLILKQMVQETLTDTAKTPDPELVLILLDTVFNHNSLDFPSLPFATKRELWRKAIHENPQEWLQRLRTLPQENQTLPSLEAMMTTQDLLESMAKVNFHQAVFLSKIMERLQYPVTRLPLSLVRGSISLEILLKKALLAYLQDPGTLDKSWNEKDITDKFLYYLQLATIGEGQGATETEQWQQLAETITTTESDHAAERSSKELLQSLTNPSVSRVTLRKSLAHLMDKHPEELLAWLEQEASPNKIARMTETMDRMQITYWSNYLTLTHGFTHASTFRQLIDWLLQRMPVGEVATALFLYVKEPGWKTFTPEQTESYFFSRLYGKTDLFPPVETLADKTLPETMRKRLFHRYLHYQPEQLLAFLREAFSQNSLPSDEWLPKTNTSDWLFLAASLSLAKAELLRQITDNLSLPEEERKKALVTYLLHSDTKEWPYLTPQETIRDFFKVMPSMQHVATEKKKEAIQQVENKLNLPETEIPFPEEQPEILTINNAGLCLLAPWFVRLFAMLGYLDEERKKFRNTASKVRAVFLLQYLVYGEEKSWREMELTFNRLLTALPGYVPLPKHLALTDEERQTADSMMAGVKANWPQMNGTSIEGFRGSFLVREGKLEQEEERWLLTVEEKAYDILLETTPWGFRQIRFPWLKKYVQVKWHEKQIF